MKLKKDFVLRQVSGSWVVLPIGSNSVNFDGMITLNESGALLWEALERGADIDGMVDALTSEYVIDRETAVQDINEFLGKLRSAGCLDA